MKKILVCCGQTAFAKLLAAADGEFELTQTEREPSAAECGEYAAALFVLPSLAAPRAETVKRLAREAAAGIAVLVRAEERAAAEELFAGFGVLVAATNDSAKNIFSLLFYAAKAGERLRLFGSENVRLRSTIDDLKLIDRAKCALIQYLNMTESDAHRFIEKQAMNRRQPKREVALEILKTYES